MEEKKIIFKWRIGKGEEKVVIEEFNLNDYNKELIENGTIAEEISLACMAIQISRNSTLFNFDAIDILKDIEGEYYGTRFFKNLNDFIIKNYNRTNNKICFNFHILEKIIGKFVALECELNKRDPGIIDERNNHVLKKINEIFVVAINDENLKIDTKGDTGLIKFKELINAIKNYSPIKNEIIKCKDKGKCIALYKKNRSNEITIAFSGFKDIRCDKIKNYIGVKKSDLLNYEKIAQSIGAQLANTTCSVSRYKFKKKQAKRYNLLKEIVHKGLNKSKVESHSCCERKIFAYLEDCEETVYGGKLFVKYEPCIQCKAAIFYHILNKGNSFSMSIGLPNL